MKLKLHFFGVDPAKPVNMLAWHLGVRGADSQKGCGLVESQEEALGVRIGETYSLAGEADADCAVYAHRDPNPAIVRQADEKYSMSGKRCVLFLERDYAYPLPTKSALVFRNSAYRSLLGPNERIMPVMGSDPMAEVQSFAPSEKPVANDSIGFCGYTGTALQRILLPLLGKGEKAKGLRLRTKALRLIPRVTRLRTDFIRRSRFRAGLQGDVLKIRGQRQRVEYLRNLMANRFSLCARGAGNFSARFYEVLACGRIPVLISSDDGLPLEDTISWGDYIIRIEIEELGDLEHLMRSFSAKMPDASFEQQSSKIRRLWLDCLSPEGFLAGQLPSLVIGNPSKPGRCTR